MATSIDNLFEKLNGSKWNAGVTFERTNPVPLDKYTVFKNFNDLSTYADSNPVSYPGQLLATVEEVSGVNFYKVNVDGSVTQLDDAIKTEIRSLSDNYTWLSSSLSSLANAIKSDEFLSGGVSYDSQMSTVISAVVLIFSKLSSL